MNHYRLPLLAGAIFIVAAHIVALSGIHPKPSFSDNADANDPNGPATQDSSATSGPDAIDAMPVWVRYADWLHELPAVETLQALVADGSVFLRIGGVIEECDPFSLPCPYWEGLYAIDIEQGRASWGTFRPLIPWAVGYDDLLVTLPADGYGYRLIDATTGDLHSENFASAVWPYRNMLITVRCLPARVGSCVVTATDPPSVEILWEVILAGESGHVRHPPASSMRGLDEPTSDGHLPRHRRLGATPPYVGVPMRGGDVGVVDTASGTLLRTVSVGSNSLVAVVDHRLLTSYAVRRGGGCTYILEVRDVASFERIWDKSGYDPGTVGEDDERCVQSGRMAVAGDLLWAIRPGDREVLLSLRDGAEVWVGQPGESVMAVDGDLVVTRREDGSITITETRGGNELWSHPPEPELVDEAVGEPDGGSWASFGDGLLVLRKPSQVTVCHVGGDRRVEVVTQIDIDPATDVVAFDATGMLLHSDELVGFVTF